MEGMLNASTSKTNLPRTSNSKTGEDLIISQSGNESALIPHTDSSITTLTYKSNITPRNLVIQRSNVNNLGSLLSQNGNSAVGIASGSVYSRQRSNFAANSHGLNYGPSVNSYALLSSTGVTAVRESSDKEKRDMQDLNERFASYIEKVRFLEAQNRRLSDELEKLKSKWGKETIQVKAMFQAELDEARKQMDDSFREKSRLEIRVASLEDMLEENNLKLKDHQDVINLQRDQLEKQNQQLSDYEAELNLMRRRIDGLESDRERDRKLIGGLQDGLNRARMDLDEQTLMHVESENHRLTLEEELEFLKTLHEQEMKELSVLAYRDSTVENREFWKNEMGQALREIQQIYDEKINVIKSEMETYYNLKVQEFKTGANRFNMETNQSKEESKRLRVQLNDLKDKFSDIESRNTQLLRDLELLRRDSENRERELFLENDSFKAELAKLRAEMESVLVELQNMMSAKLSLELEIAAYRKLLECEENRSGLKTILDNYSYVGGSGGAASSGLNGSSGIDSQLLGGGGAAYTAGSFVRESFGGGVSNLKSTGMGISGNFGPGSFSQNSEGGLGVSGSSVANGGRLSGSNMGGQGISDKINQQMKMEMSAKTTYHKSSKGPLSISDCTSDGKLVVLDNTGRKVENLSGWKIVRNVDSSSKFEFVFKEGFSLNPASKVKIWAKGCKPEYGSEEDLECLDESWGIGANVVTKLYNIYGEERASHIQKTIYI